MASNQHLETSPPPNNKSSPPQTSPDAEVNKGWRDQSSVTNLVTQLKQRCHDTFKSLQERLASASHEHGDDSCSISAAEVENFNHPNGPTFWRKEDKPFHGLSIYLMHHFSASCTGPQNTTNQSTTTANSSHRRSLTSQLLKLGATCSLSLTNPSTIIVVNDSALLAFEE